MTNPNVMENLPPDNMEWDDHRDAGPMKSPSVKSLRSGSVKSVKSGSSGKASISVTLPLAAADDLERDSPVQIRTLSPERLRYVNRDTSARERSFSPRSFGTIPPQGTPTEARPILNQVEYVYYFELTCNLFFCEKKLWGKNLKRTFFGGKYILRKNFLGHSL